MEKLIYLDNAATTLHKPPQVAQAVAQAVPGLRLYSDLTNADLNTAIAAHWGVQQENILRSEERR